MTITWSIACLPARAFPRFQWRGGTATHARSEITLGSGAGGHERRVRNVARGPGPAAAKDALVAVAALSLGPLFTQVRRVIT